MKLPGDDVAAGAAEVDLPAGEPRDDEAAHRRRACADGEAVRGARRPVAGDDDERLSLVNPGSVVPSIVTGSVIAGSVEAGVIVCTPEPAIANAIRSCPEAAFASWIAARSVQLPEPSLQLPSPGSRPRRLRSS